MSKYVSIASCAKECRVDVAIVYQDEDILQGVISAYIKIPEGFLVERFTTKITDGDQITYSNESKWDILDRDSNKIKEKGHFFKVESISCDKETDSIFQPLCVKDVERIFKNGASPTSITMLKPYNAQEGCSIRSHLDNPGKFLEVTYDDIYLLQDDVSVLKRKYGQESSLTDFPQNFQEKKDEKRGQQLLTRRAIKTYYVGGVKKLNDLKWKHIFDKESKNRLMAKARSADKSGNKVLYIQPELESWLIENGYFMLTDLNRLREGLKSQPFI